MLNPVKIYMNTNSQQRIYFDLRFLNKQKRIHFKAIYFVQLCPWDLAILENSQESVEPLK